MQVENGVRIGQWAKNLNATGLETRKGFNKGYCPYEWTDSDTKILIAIKYYDVTDKYNNVSIKGLDTHIITSITAPI